MIILPNLEQGSDKWLRARLGVLTASQAERLLTKTMKPSTQAKALKAKLVAEKLLGQPVENFGGTYWTERGNELEAEAGAYFALQTGLEPKAVGFVYRDESKRAGCSPDWLCFDGEDPATGVEVKCPYAETHMGYVMGGGAEKYTPQVQFSLWVTQLPSWWFMSYHPGLPPFLVEQVPEPAWQAAFDKIVPPFLDEVHEAIGRYQ